MKLFSKLLLAILMIGLAFEPLMAHEGTIGLEFRTDLEFNSSDRDSDDDPNGDDQVTKFNIARARMNFRGTLNDTTSYRARVRFNRAAERNEFDNTSDMLQYWYLDRKLSSALKLRVGKQFTVMGSWENDYSGMDQYHYSEGPVRAVYDTGASLHVSFASQTVLFQLFNSPFQQTNQSTLGFNLAWYGDIANGLISPIASFTVLPSAEQDDGENKRDAFTENSWAVGARLSVQAIQVEAEARNTTTPEYDDEINAAEKSLDDPTILEDTWDTIVLQARYKTKMFAPFIKYTTDDHNVDGDDVTNHTGTSLGVEFFPDGSIKTYRVHAVFITESTDYEDKERDDVTTTQFNIGVSARFSH